MLTFTESARLLSKKVSYLEICGLKNEDASRPFATEPNGGTNPNQL